MSEDKRLCFVVSPIGEGGSETRRRSDNLYQYVVTPVVKEAGYEVTRADKLSETGDITIQIVQRLIDSSLVVADLTDSNPNVFYELAVRHAAKKPVVHLIKKGQRLPFDIQQLRAISYDLTDLGFAEACKVELRRQVASFDKKRLL